MIFLYFSNLPANLRKQVFPLHAFDSSFACQSRMDPIPTHSHTWIGTSHSKILFRTSECTKFLFRPAIIAKIPPLFPSLISSALVTSYLSSASLHILPGLQTASWTSVNHSILIRICDIMTFIYSVTLLMCMISERQRRSVEYELGGLAAPVDNT